MSDGSFNPAARAAIYEAAGHRCVGCGRTDLSCQHRRARGMGGTSSVSIGHPANGVALCGDGVRGCHGWAERHRGRALLLGWALDHATDALGSPWWHTGWGWRAWVEDPEDRFVGVVYVDPADLDQRSERVTAVLRMQADRSVAAPMGKPTR